MRQFTLYNIINFPNETAEDRESFADLASEIANFPDISLNLLINPLFPMPNSFLERYGMEDPETTLSRIDDMWRVIEPRAASSHDQMKNPLSTHNRGAYHGEGTNVNVRVVSAVDQFIEGLTLKGHRESGLVVYDLWRNGMFKGDFGVGHLQSIKQYLSKRGIDYRQAFNEIPSNELVPWELVRPFGLSRSFDRYSLRASKSS